MSSPEKRMQLERAGDCDFDPSKDDLCSLRS
jgi:hypothetical protein